MHAVRLLLDSVLDYAGLFPPAKLDMQPTVANFARYRKGPDSWMLARLIVPVTRFPEFVEHAEEHLPVTADVEGEEPWPLSVLVAPASDRQIVADLERIENFNERMGDRDFSRVEGRAVIDTIETKATTPNEIDRALEYVPDEIFAYFEVPVDADPRGLVAAMASLDAGAKIRTGGVTPDAHPTPEQVARFLKACRAADGTGYLQALEIGGGGQNLQDLPSSLPTAESPTRTSSASAHAGAVTPSRRKRIRFIHAGWPP